MSEPADPRAPYLSDFESLSKEFYESEPDWLRTVRAAGLARFRDVGFPTLKDEMWRYTNVAPIVKQRFVPSVGLRGDGVSEDRVRPARLSQFEGSELLFLNGRYMPRLSKLKDLPPGVRVGSLSKMLAWQPNAVEGKLGRFARIEGSPFTALNAAFLQDGAFVEVPKGAFVEHPIHLLFLATFHPQPTASFLRNLIVVGEEGRVTVTESYVGLDEGVYLTNSVTEALVADRGRLDHYKLQRESEHAFHVGTLQIHQGRDSVVSDNSLSFGGAIVRNDVNAWFDGEGGELSLYGLYSTHGTQHVDNHTRIDHARPACTSRELYKGILDGRSRGIFYGNIIVHKDAQKTNAMQTNKNLLLSKDALADSIPGLQILANDVKCKHGSSIGQLDEAAIFYLRSRGLDAEAARALLTYAFAREVVDQVKVAAMHAVLSIQLASRLPQTDAVREVL
ncbi:MAG TPA: Fe-S cluster assembly protein SufD [Thermoplasmata archaeon]|nr:Fe-S cluster assembly protein SufD [Thermoplasmata archaeon]